MFTAPSAEAPDPRFASGPSPPPRNTGVPGSSPRPASGEPGERRKARSPETGCESRSSPTPASASAAGCQRRARRSSRPVEEAIEWSTAHSPTRGRVTYSLMETKRRAAEKRSGRSSRSQASLASGKIPLAGQPVARYRSSALSRAFRRSACGSARPSDQRMLFASGSSWPSTGNTPYICEEKAMARTSPGAAPGWARHVRWRRTPRAAPAPGTAPPGRAPAGWWGSRAALAPTPRRWRRRASRAPRRCRCRRRARVPGGGSCAGSLEGWCARGGFTASPRGPTGSPPARPPRLRHSRFVHFAV